MYVFCAHFHLPIYFAKVLVLEIFCKKNENIMQI